MDLFIGRPVVEILGPVEAVSDKRGVTLLLNDTALQLVVDNDGRAPVMFHLLLHLGEL